MTRDRIDTDDPRVARLDSVTPSHRRDAVPPAAPAHEPAPGDLLAGSANRDRYDALSRPLPPTSPRRWAYATVRLFLMTAGRLSDGVRIGWRHGFDSGPSLDHAYRNSASGITPLGRWLDRLYLDTAGWRAIRARKALLERLLGRAIAEEAGRGGPVPVLDLACGGGRYVLDAVAGLPRGTVTLELRDRDEAALARARELARARGIEATFRQASAFDPVAVARTRPRPRVAVVSGLYELFADNDRILLSLHALAAATAGGGQLVYTNQPHHPQLELIARTLVNAEGQPWVMRCRPQAEMDALVRTAGFEPVETAADERGIVTVTRARRVRA